MTHAPGMAHRIGDRDGAALRHSEKREPIDPGCVDDALEVTYECFEGKIRYVPIREPVPTRVIPKEPVLGSDPVEERTPDRAFPVILQVIEPVACFDQRHALPDLGK
jgi:hypothetical protein